MTGETVGSMKVSAIRGAVSSQLAGQSSDPVKRVIMQTFPHLPRRQTERVMRLLLTIITSRTGSALHAPAQRSAQIPSVVSSIAHFGPVFAPRHNRQKANTGTEQ
jgi:hypothetical protein